jgi:hypothetical protein
VLVTGVLPVEGVPVEGVPPGTTGGVGGADGGVGVGVGAGVDGNVVEGVLVTGGFNTTASRVLGLI